MGEMVREEMKEGEKGRDPMPRGKWIIYVEKGNVPGKRECCSEGAPGLRGENEKVGEKLKAKTKSFRGEIQLEQNQRQRKHTETLREKIGVGETYLTDERKK